MITPEDKESALFDHPAAEELFSYLFSFLLYRRRVNINSLDANSFGAVSAHVQAEMDSWTASRDSTPLAPAHPSFRYRFSQTVQGEQWYLQPNGAKLIGVRFESAQFGVESLYAEIDLGDGSDERQPKVSSIFRSNPALDFVVTQQSKDRLLRMLSVNGSGKRALLFPKSRQTNSWEVMPLAELSLGSDEANFAGNASYKTVPLHEFI